MQDRTLLIFTAFLEIITAMGLLLTPAFIIRLLLGAEIDDPVVFTITRTAGSGLLSIGIICWRARNSQKDTALKAIISGLLVYNIAVVAVLGISAISYKTTLVLFAALLVHGALAVFDIASLKKFGRSQ